MHMCVEEKYDHNTMKTWVFSTEALPLEAFLGRHSGGGDLNHRESHQHQIVSLPKEQAWRERMYCIQFKKTKKRVWSNNEESQTANSTNLLSPAYQAVTLASRTSVKTTLPLDWVTNILSRHSFSSNITWFWQEEKKRYKKLVHFSLFHQAHVYVWKMWAPNYDLKW
jgi:hypothetical protein